MGYSSNCRAITKMTTLTTFVVERSRHVCKVSPKIGGIKNTPLYCTYLLPKKTLCDTFNYQYYNLRSIQSRPFKAFAKIWSKLPKKKIMRKIRPSTHLSTKVLLSQYILVQQTRSILTFCLRNYGGTGWKIGLLLLLSFFWLGVVQPYAYDNMTRKDHDVLVAQDRAKLKGYSVSCSRQRGLFGAG